jgi:hypothetical protein
MAKQQKTLIKIPSGYNKSNREAIAQDIVQWIQDRTEMGVNDSGRNFKAYSKDYAKEKGVKPSDVNLRESGDMMNNLQVLRVGYESIDIGYQSGDPINDKVEGNRIGSYGGAENPSKARDFLGITQKDLNSILKNYPMSEDEKFNNQLDKTLTDLYNSLTPSQKAELANSAQLGN